MKIRVAMEGYQKNPLKDVNRNELCICGSDRKVKRCCGRDYYVPNKWGDEVRELLNGMTEKLKTKVGYEK